MTVVDPHKLLEHLCGEPIETEWLEFKLNRFDPEEVGKYISGLANSAMFLQQERAYLVFGVDDKTHEVRGTGINLRAEKVGNQIFEQWLAQLLHPHITLEFISLDCGGKSVEMIVIDPGYISPVRFKTEAYIRVNSVQQPLREFPERERAIWSVTSRYSFEQGVAASHVSDDDIFALLDCETLLKQMKNNKGAKLAVIEQLLMEGLILDDKQGGFDITNLFAIVAAKDLANFSLKGKAPRVIHYSGTNKLEAVDDVTGGRGYGVTFSRLLRYIMDRISHREEIVHGVRRKTYGIPEVSVRELVANALIHQDLTSSGDGPRIEVFSDKVRITNPGKPLIAPERFIDAPAKSRNEKLAGLMRRLGICEERGSGIDRALDAIERAALPPPLFQEVENSTIVTVFSEKTFASMAREDRLRACYQHASLRFESGSPMSNSTLRARFGLSDKQYPQVSVVIREAIEANLIRPLDEDQAKRTARYVPWWVM